MELPTKLAIQTLLICDLLNVASDKYIPRLFFFFFFILMVPPLSIEPTGEAPLINRSYQCYM